MKKVALSLFAICVLWLSSAAQAQERILSFHSDIQIQSDAAMVVTETIRVQAEGVNIRRGIYREFPTRYRDQYGNRVVVDFEVLGVTRDGRPEILEVTRLYNGVRIDLGGDDLLSVPGQYEYALTYRTRRQIGYFDSHDELYWNVTGNGWNFRIDQASASVRLPEAIAASAITMEGYTGPQGATGQDYQTSISSGQASIVTTSALPPSSGLTLVMTFPKGLVQAPGALEKIGYLLRDNQGLLLALLGFAGSLVWLLWAWKRVGRDPEKGVIFPHYQAPADLSPAAVRFILKMGYDFKAFTAAVVNLAVKGHVRIIQEKSRFTLQKLESSQPLTVDEQTLFSRLFASGAVIKLENENHSVVGSARSAHRAILRKNYIGRYFSNNGRYLIPSFVLVLAMTFIIVAMQTMSPLAALLTGMSLAMHALFLKLMQAPSLEGRQLMDKLEGFKLYLETAEKDDLDLAHPPELTPEVFEQLLPYAIGLGVEQAWGKKFENVFARLKEEKGIQYHPVWYIGSFNPVRMAAFSSAVGSSMSAAISSASTPPGSSSGAGGGGFSGGGGGGGGGGGR